jgi:hypothetical protein
VGNKIILNFSIEFATDNSIEDGGMYYLSEALQINNSIRRLILQCNFRDTFLVSLVNSMWNTRRRIQISE